LLRNPHYRTRNGSGGFLFLAYASWYLAAGARLPELKELMGHQTIEMTMRYAHLTPNATRTIIERI